MTSLDQTIFSAVLHILLPLAICIVYNLYQQSLTYKIKRSEIGYKILIGASPDDSVNCFFFLTLWDL